MVNGGKLTQCKDSVHASKPIILRMLLFSEVIFVSGWKEVMQYFILGTEAILLVKYAKCYRSKMLQNTNYNAIIIFLAKAFI